MEADFIHSVACAPLGGEALGTSRAQNPTVEPSRGAAVRGGMPGPSAFAG